jgi:formylmethanofuran dehydrogenase subunit B
MNMSKPLNQNTKIHIATSNHAQQQACDIVAWGTNGWRNSARKTFRFTYRDTYDNPYVLRKISDETWRPT